MICDHLKTIIKIYFIIPYNTIISCARDRSDGIDPKLAAIAPLPFVRCVIIIKHFHNVISFYLFEALWKVFFFFFPGGFPLSSVHRRKNRNAVLSADQLLYRSRQAACTFHPPTRTLPPSKLHPFRRSTTLTFDNVKTVKAVWWRGRARP